MGAHRPEPVHDIARRVSLRRAFYTPPRLVPAIRASSLSSSAALLPQSPPSSASWASCTRRSHSSRRLSALRRCTAWRRFSSGDLVCWSMSGSPNCPSESVARKRRGRTLQTLVPKCTSFPSRRHRGSPLSHLTGSVRHRSSSIVCRPGSPAQTRTSVRGPTRPAACTPALPGRAPACRESASSG